MCLGAIAMTPFGHRAVACYRGYPAQMTGQDNPDSGLAHLLELEPYRADIAALCCLRQQHDRVPARWRSKSGRPGTRRPDRRAASTLQTGSAPLTVARWRLSARHPALGAVIQAGRRRFKAAGERGHGVSTSRLDELMRAMGLNGIVKSTVSGLCKDIDAAGGGFLICPLCGKWPDVRLGAICRELLHAGRGLRPDRHGADRPVIPPDPALGPSGT